MTGTEQHIYAVVEIFGRRQRAGIISDATMGGATMLRVQHPSRLDYKGDPLAEFYLPGALFAVRPCSPEEANAINAWAWPEPSTTPALPAAVGEVWEDPDDELYYDDGSDAGYGS